MIEENGVSDDSDKQKRGGSDQNQWDESNYYEKYIIKHVGYRFS